MFDKKVYIVYNVPVKELIGNLACKIQRGIDSINFKTL